MRSYKFCSLNLESKVQWYHLLDKKWRRFCGQEGEGVCLEYSPNSLSSLQLYIFRSAGKITNMKLNMYDFHKTRQENQENAFKNLMFKRGSKHLLKDIERKDYKKKK